MKKILIVIAIIILAFLGYSFYKPSTSVPVSTTGNPANTTSTTPEKDPVAKAPDSNVVETKTDSKLLQRLGSASVAVSEDGTKVNLLNGTATFSTPDSNAKNTVSIASIATSKTSGNRKDVIAVVNLSSGGVSSQYLVLFGDSGTKLEQQSIAYLGQGLDVRGVIATDLPNSGYDYVVSVSALTQKPGKTATFIMPVKDGAFDTAKAISL